MALDTTKLIKEIATDGYYPTIDIFSVLTDGYYPIVAPVAAPTPSAPGGGDRIFVGDERALKRYLDKLKESKLDDELAEVLSVIIAKGILN